MELIDFKMNSVSKTKFDELSLLYSLVLLT